MLFSHTDPDARMEDSGRKVHRVSLHRVQHPLGNQLGCGESRTSEQREEFISTQRAHQS
jgi:hypothetical protein